MDKKNRLVIRCDDEFLKLIDNYKALNRYPFANDNSRSNIVRSIVEKYINLEIEMSKKEKSLSEKIEEKIRNEFERRSKNFLK